MNYQFSRTDSTWVDSGGLHNIGRTDTSLFATVWALGGGYLYSPGTDTVFPWPSNVSDTLFYRCRLRGGSVAVTNEVPVSYVANNKWDTTYTQRLKLDSVFHSVVLPLSTFGWQGGVTINSAQFYFNGEMGVKTPNVTANPYIPFEAGAGTSISAPFVTGTIALMLEKYSRYTTRVPNIHTGAFWPSTAKAILVHTATDLSMGTAPSWLASNPDLDSFATPVHTAPTYGSGPDWATGYGLVNAKKAISYTDTTKFLEDTIDQSQFKYYSLNVPAGKAKMRVTLAWDDLGSGVLDMYTPKLINDLDLYLVPPSGQSVSLPWKLDASKLKASGDGIDSSYSGGSWRRGIDTASVTPAVKGVDGLNNLEVVDISNPAQGSWTVVVKARRLDMYQSKRIGLLPSQDFSIVADTLVSSAGTGSLGLTFTRTGARMETTDGGDFNIQGQATGGSVTGLKFGIAASVNDTGNFVRSSLSEQQASWLDTPGNFVGGLVFTDPQGQVTTHVSQVGAVRIRGRAHAGFGTF